MRSAEKIPLSGRRAAVLRAVAEVGGTGDFETILNFIFFQVN